MEFLCHCVPVSPSQRTVEATGRGPGWRAGPPGPSPGAQLDSGIRPPGRGPTPPGPLLPAISPARGLASEGDTLPPRHPVDKNSRAQALGTVMEATCWPDVPGSHCQESGGPGAQNTSPAPPRRPRPAPTREAWRAYMAEFTFLRFPKSCARTWVAGARLRSRSRRSPSRAHPQCVCVCAWMEPRFRDSWVLRVI